MLSENFPLLGTDNVRGQKSSIFSRQMETIVYIFSRKMEAIREVKHDVYGKRQTAKMKLLPSVFSSLCIRIKVFVFAVNSKRHYFIFV